MAGLGAAAVGGGACAAPGTCCFDFVTFGPRTPPLPGAGEPRQSGRRQRAGSQAGAAVELGRRPLQPALPQVFRGRLQPSISNCWRAIHIRNCPSNPQPQPGLCLPFGEIVPSTLLSLLRHWSGWCPDRLQAES
ncbi:unnamed protein product [Eretmochelys imbricata]